MIDRYRSHDTSYSDIVAVPGTGRFLFVAGQLAFDDDRRLIEGDVTAQAHRCLDIIETLLRRHSAGLADIVKITTYLVDLEDYPAFEQVRRERFGEHRPASAAVGVADLLFGASIEIEAIAFVAS
ncbi:MAG TPA: RidA family protein [Acidimicrobiia bacterium]|jgi:2-iminobutanoate/2-iminopropanoate deaminase|nr:RidA family protein [Acidimicrobiia bacterium]